MSATYVEINLQEMCCLLKPEKGWQEVATNKEYVFDWEIPSLPGVIVRVYTSIDKRSAVSRGCGRDAIRVCAVDTNTGKGLMKSRRVHRTENWRENIKARVFDAIRLAKQRAGR